jgi:mRNA-degrading endonuclease RelE of RelBE toxin-antitoxin system
LRIALQEVKEHKCKPLSELWEGISDIHKGKSGGYRVIYQIVNSTTVVLLYLYCKSDKDNIGLDEIGAIIKNFKTSN